MPTSCDAIVIGAGQAGPFLAAKLAAAGQRTVLIERKHLGGTCVNAGCMPTKTLVASARVAHLARRAADFGVHIDGAVTIDMKAVKARKDRIVNQAVDNLSSWLDGLPNLRVIRGHARFADAHAVLVNGERIEAPKIFINTGGRALQPDWPGLDGVDVLTNTSILDLDTLPEHLVIAGGSYIGLEFAQIYRRFGARVTVLEQAERLIAREDAEVSQAVHDLLAAEGITCHLGVRGVRAARNATGGVQLEFRCDGSSRSVDASHLLAAVGRRPNTDDLGLETTAIMTDARGFIQVDEQLRTNVAGVWALGDANGRGAFTHTSYHDHEVVAANLLGGEVRRVSERIPAYALFTDPPLARIGLNEAEVRARGRPALVGVLPMTRVGRARERGETSGFMKVFVDAQTERFLGAALLCIEADEIVHSLLDIMAADVSYKVVQRAVHIHPTVSELIPTLLGQLAPLGARA